MTRTAIGAFLLAVLLSPSLASAQLSLDFGAAESPQYFALEFKFGPYAPNVDQNASATPFADIYGDGTGLISRAELDLQLWNGFGTIGVGLSGGYYTKSAKAFVDDGGDKKKLSDSDTSITLIPITLLAVYRFDLLPRKFGIPIVPFAKVGINYTLWFLYRPDGELSRYPENGDDASGGTLGWQVNLGAALQLDFLQPSAARTMDSEIGINHTYLFFEFIHLQADGFGNDSKLNVGDTSFVGGLALEF